MTRIRILQIPQGFLHLYEQVFNFSNSTQSVAAKPARTPFPPAYRAQLRAQAPALLLKDTWNALTDDQKAAWHFYWGGWPGSGYSAFLQQNSYAFTYGDPLVLDPPENFGTEILVNHNFAKFTSTWHNPVGAFGVVKKQGVLPYPSKISQIFSHVSGNTYRLRIRAQVFKIKRTRNLNFGSFRIGISEDSYTYDFTQRRDKYCYQNLDITPTHATGNLTFYIENIDPRFSLILDKVSLKKLL